MPTETISFVGGAGAQLEGILHRAEGTPKGAVLLAHCFSCGKDIHTTSRVASALAASGYAAFRFDFTGLGESEGAFETTSVSSNVADLTRAAVTLIERGFGPCAMVGHSLGGAAALLAAHRLKTLDAVATIAAPSTVTHVQRLFTDRVPTIRTKGKAEVSVGGTPFCLGEVFLDDLEEHEVLDAAAALTVPYLAIVATADTVVEPANGHALAAAAPDGRVVEIDGADHLFSKRAHADQVAQALVSFLDEVKGFDA
jgi:alpha-beta hydrolase superfamily lysophospholipase